MKQFLRIFCLYLFVLSCLPCNDGEHGHDAVPSKGETTVQTHDHDGPPHEHCADFCSPFCTCTCCGCSFSNEEPVDFQLSELGFAATISQSNYSSPFSGAHLTALFRPPIYTLG